MESPRSKTILFVLVLIVLLYGCFELLCVGSLAILRVWKHHRYIPVSADLHPEQRQGIEDVLKNGPKSGYEKRSRYQRDPELGWLMKADSDNAGGHVNTQGIRSERDHSLQKPAGKTRLVAFGESFTFGSTVKNHETWTAVLEQRNPSIEVLNFGVEAYGLDQAFLRYEREAKNFSADILLIGYMSENINRHINRLRIYYEKTFPFYGKPRFQIKDDTLALVPNPLATHEDYQRMLDDAPAFLSPLAAAEFHYGMQYHPGRFDFMPSVRFFKIAVYGLRRYFFHPLKDREGIYRKDSEAFQVTAKLLDSFYKTGLENQMQPVILLFPTYEDILRHGKKKPVTYAYLLRYLAQKKYRVIDFLPAFAAQMPARKPAFFFEPRFSHYSPAGNKIVAEALAAYLKREKLL